MSTVSVGIVEQDPYSRNWITMLLARDWRTQVMFSAADITDLLNWLKLPFHRLDSIILDENLPAQWIDHLDQLVSKGTRVIILGENKLSTVDRSVSGHHRVRGLILKEEIRDSIGWAVDFIMNNHSVCTPGIPAYLLDDLHVTGKPVLQLDGRKNLSHLSNHEIEVARLALIYSMERRELAHELGVTENWGYGLVGAVYEKLGLEEIISGQVDLPLYLREHPYVKERMKRIIEKARTSHKAAEKEALAFHILTLPEIIEA